MEEPTEVEPSVDATDNEAPRERRKIQLTKSKRKGKRRWLPLVTTSMTMYSKEERDARQQRRLEKADCCKKEAWKLYNAMTYTENQVDAGSNMQICRLKPYDENNTQLVDPPSLRTMGVLYNPLIEKRRRFLNKKFKNILDTFSIIKGAPLPPYIRPTPPKQLDKPGRGKTLPAILKNVRPDINEEFIIPRTFAATMNWTKISNLNFKDDATVRDQATQTLSLWLSALRIRQLGTYGLSAMDSATAISENKQSIASQASQVSQASQGSLDAASKEPQPVAPKPDSQEQGQQPGAQPSTDPTCPVNNSPDPQKTPKLSIDSGKGQDRKMSTTPDPSVQSKSVMSDTPDRQQRHSTVAGQGQDATIRTLEEEGVFDIEDIPLDKMGNPIGKTTGFCEWCGNNILPIPTTHQLRTVWDRTSLYCCNKYKQLIADVDAFEKKEMLNNEKQIVNVKPHSKYSAAKRFEEHKKKALTQINEAPVEHFDKSVDTMDLPWDPYASLHRTKKDTDDDLSSETSLHAYMYPDIVAMASGTYLYEPTLPEDLRPDTTTEAAQAPGGAPVLETVKEDTEDVFSDAGVKETDDESHHGHESTTEASDDKEAQSDTAF